jgi:sulfite dehydrogenase
MGDTSEKEKGLNRRRFLQAAAALGAAGLFNRASAQGEASQIELPMAHGERPLVKYPQKRPLIQMTTRPPQLETPFTMFNEGVITPNDAFFVRYHLARIPTSIDENSFRIKVHGSVNQELTLSIEDLKSNYQPIEITAVNQCSGNSRGLFDPRVAGGQWANGAMGNAVWKGVPLRDVLNKAGLKVSAKQVTFNGLDGPVIDTTPDFVKALDVDHAMNGEVMIAYAMNDEDLPVLNGYPARLIVPGYFGTYWVKHLDDIQVVDDTFKGFWMDPAYRIPDNACACVPPGTKPKKTVPINRMNVRSFITSLQDGATLRANQRVNVRGIAFDGGYGIKSVAVSADGGRTWQEARLGKDLGKYSFREWQIAYVPKRPGVVELQVRAVNRRGETQPARPSWNPAGYMRNVIETVRVKVV